VRPTPDIEGVEVAHGRAVDMLEADGYLLRIPPRLAVLRQLYKAHGLGPQE
jgi:hypothetical protein